MEKPPLSIITDVSSRMEISFKTSLNSIYQKNKAWKPEATQYLPSWKVKCRTWGYACTPEHEFQPEKVQRCKSYRDTLCQHPEEENFHTAHKLTWWTTSVHIWNSFLFFTLLKQININQQLFPAVQLMSECNFGSMGVGIYKLFKSYKCRDRELSGCQPGLIQLFLGSSLLDKEILFF